MFLDQTDWSGKGVSYNCKSLSLPDSSQPSTDYTYCSRPECFWEGKCENNALMVFLGPQGPLRTPSFARSSAPKIYITSTAL